MTVQTVQPSYGVFATLSAATDELSRLEAALKKRGLSNATLDEYERQVHHLNLSDEVVCSKYESEKLLDRKRKLVLAIKAKRPREKFKFKKVEGQETLPDTPIVAPVTEEEKKEEVAEVVNDGIKI